jgi:hypothetical protein
MAHQPAAHRGRLGVFHGLFVYTLQMPFPEGLLLRW